MTISHSTEWERPGIGLNFLLADKQEVRRREYGDPKLRSSALDAIQGQFRQRRLLSAQELVCSSMERAPWAGVSAPVFLGPMTRLTPASLVGARWKDHVSPGSDSTGEEGMLVRGLGKRRGFLRSVSRR